MENIFSDIATAIKLTGEVREARKEGTKVEIQQVFRVPVLKPSYWGFTMEACLLDDRKTRRAVLAVFSTFSKPVQHALTFTPENPGEWIARAKFWQQKLKPSLPPKMYHAVMARFTGWYARCLRMRKESASMKCSIALPVMLKGKV